MHHSKVTGAIALALLVFSVPVLAGQNLVQNSSFDHGIAGWTADNELVELTFRSDAGSTLTDGSGPGCLEVQISFWDGGLSGAWTSAAVTEFHTYTFAVSFFRPSADNVASDMGLAATWYNNQGNINTVWVTAVDLDLDDAWMRLVGTATAPAGATGVTFSLKVGNPSIPTETRPGIVYFDDVWLSDEDIQMATQELFVPAGASVAGDKGTFWTTDVWIHNAVDVPITVAGAVLEPNKDNSAAVAAPTQLAIVPPYGLVVVEDVFGALGKSLTGGLYLRATSPEANLPATLMVVMSRTSTPNSEGGGSYGQALPAVGPGNEGKVIAPGLFENQDYRTNIGVLNTSSSEIQVDVEVRNGGGGWSRVASWTLQPYEFRMKSAASLGASRDDGGTVYFIRRSSVGSFRAFTSTADNITGDSVYNAAR